MNLDPELLSIEAGTRALQDVFLNIINNVPKAFVTDVGRPKKLEISTRAEAGPIHIALTDSGPGIPEADFRRVFDPFFTTRRAGESFHDLRNSCWVGG